MTTDEQFKEDVAIAVETDTGSIGNRYGVSRPVSVEGSRVEVEFWCGECEHYIYVKINSALDGNHVMVCPQCGHKHYRLVKRGIITADRYNENQAIADEIICTKSAAVPKEKRRERGSIAIIRELELAGVLR